MSKSSGREMKPDELLKRYCIMAPIIGIKYLLQAVQNATEANFIAIMLWYFKPIHTYAIATFDFLLHKHPCYPGITMGFLFYRQQ
jgi:hypothetical protein